MNTDAGHDLAIEPEAVTQEDLNLWYTLKENLSNIKADEANLRRKIFAFFFRDPREGTNKVPLSDGYVLKGDSVVNRALDPGQYEAMREQLKAAGVPDDIVVLKPEMVLREYRTLTDEQRALFDQCLIIKPGMPGLDVVQPKRGVK